MNDVMGADFNLQLAELRQIGIVDGILTQLVKRWLEKHGERRAQVKVGYVHGFCLDLIPDDNGIEPSVGAIFESLNASLDAFGVPR